MITISKDSIIKYSKLYDERYRKTDDWSVEKEIKEWLKSHRYLDKERFIKIGLWKSKRPRKRYESNDGKTVREITQFSFRAESERARIESLFVLKGVFYPLASVILHFAFPERYPILDYRALWSLGWNNTVYNFDFWQKYCEKIREIAKTVSEDIRTIDKALWEYSKRHQSPKE